MGNSTVSTYDDADQLVGRIDASGNVVIYTYDLNGRQETVTNAEGVVTRKEYDSYGYLVRSVTNWNDGVFDSAEPDTDIETRYEYDLAGNTIIVTDTHSTSSGQALGHATRTWYDAQNRALGTLVNWDGETTLAGCFAQGAPLPPVRDENVCTLYAYDVAGSTVITQTAHCNFPPTSPDTNLCTVTTYDGDRRSLGQRNATRDPMDNLTEFDYDAHGRLVTTTRYLDDGITPVVTVSHYDALGNRVGQTDARGNTTTYIYDHLGRLETSISAEGVANTQGYDEFGRVVTATNGLGHEIVTGDDVLGRRVTATNAEGNVTQYEYDALGNQATITDANNVRASFLYDDLNRMAGVIENQRVGEPMNQDTNVLTQYVYDALGNRIVITDPSTGSGQAADGGVTHYAYDGLNRLVSIKYPKFTVQYAYDAVGNRTVMTDSVGVTTYGYDDLGRLISVDDPITGTVGYGYDLVGNRTHLTYPTGEVVTYTYDADNRLVQVEDWDEGLTSYEYDVAGRLTATELPNGVVTVNEYDDAGRLINLKDRIQVVFNEATRPKTAPQGACKGV